MTNDQSHTPSSPKKTLPPYGTPKVWDRGTKNCQSSDYHWVTSCQNPRALPAMVLHHPSLSHKNCPGLALSRFLIDQDIVIYWGCIYIIIIMMMMMIMITMTKKHINNDHNIYIYTHVKFKVVNSLGLYKLVYRTPQKDRNIIYHNSGRMLLFYLCWHLL